MLCISVEKLKIWQTERKAMKFKISFKCAHALKFLLIVLDLKFKIPFSQNWVHVWISLAPNFPPFLTHRAVLLVFCRVILLAMWLLGIYYGYIEESYQEIRGLVTRKIKEFLAKPFVSTVFDFKIIPLETVFHDKY